MATSPETHTGNALIRYNLSLEGYISPAEEALLDKIEASLADHGLDASQLVFSGFDGSVIRGRSLPSYDHIFAMNDAGWREAIEQNTMNPAEYAQTYDKPCIGVYDKYQLAEAYAYDTSTVDENHEGLLSGRVEIINVEVGARLQDLSPETVVNEAVVHADYPYRQVTDAMVALIRLKD